MNCMYCGAPAGNTDICPECGQDLSVQKKALQLSVRYYNQGLDKAQIRDLSGAIDLLQRSLKYNKLNIPARNLLGLVYFETGEAVSALSEWVISKNILPEGNIATEYIQRVQAEPAKLDTINQTIKKYNIALRCCREGNDDVAAIQLKKILSQNPKLIKAYHLLALIYIRREAYERARKILKKAARIDKTNATTLRFLKEIDEQTGTVTSLEGRQKGRRKKDSQEQKPDSASGEQFPLPDGEAVIQPAAYRETSMRSAMINIITGIVIGALAVWFLAVPSVRRSVNREADERIVQYSNTVAAQEAQIQNLEEEVETSAAETEAAQQQAAEAEKRQGVYDRLVTALKAYQEQDYDGAAESLEGLDVSLLSTEAKEAYDSIYPQIQGRIYAALVEEGKNAFDYSRYAEAVDKLTQARAMDGEDYEVLAYLASAYRLSGDSANAISVYQEIVEKFPGRRAESARNQIEQLSAGAGDEPAGNAGRDGADDSGDEPDSAAGAEGTDDDASGAGEDTGDQEPAGLPAEDAGGEET
jgi:tetratricopeptide (TPR) repeat protein